MADCGVENLLIFLQCSVFVKVEYSLHEQKPKICKCLPLFSVRYILHRHI